MSALVNISGGLSYVISSLSKSKILESCSSPTQTTDTLGALTSALMIYDDNAEYTKASDPLAVEQTLLEQFKPHSPFASLAQLLFQLDMALNYLEMVSQIVFLEQAGAKSAFRGLAYKRYNDNEMNSGIGEKDLKRQTLEQNVHHGNGKQEIFEKNKSVKVVH
ncbi:hypothetical protein RYX36_014827 [Vicia faba]